MSAPRGRQRRLWAGVVALLVATSGVSWWIGTHSDSPGARATRAAAPPPSVITATVTQTRLVDAVRGSASVRSAGSVDVAARAPAGSDAVITKMPCPLGATVKAATVVVEVAGRPVIALPGAFGMYRDLAPGMSGPDVAELQQALRAAGHDTGTDGDGVFGAGTEKAVSALYSGAGYAAPKEVPRGELLFLPQLPARVSAVALSVGDRADKPVLTLAYGDVTAQASVSPADAARLRAGMAAVITSAGGKETAATVSSVGAARADKSGRNVADVALKPKSGSSLATGDGYTFTVELRKSAVTDLVAPVTALWADASGQPRVSVAVADGSRREVPVRVAFTVDGRAAISPLTAGGLRAGDEVIVGVRGSSSVTADD